MAAAAAPISQTTLKLLPSKVREAKAAALAIGSTEQASRPSSNTLMVFVAAVLVCGGAAAIVVAAVVVIVFYCCC